MDLSKKQKIALGIGTIWPMIWIVIFIAGIIGMMLGAGLTAGSGGGDAIAPVFGIGFMALFAGHLLTMIVMLASKVFYIIHAVKNESLESNMRIVWIVLFFFGGMIAEPIYWYLEIWREKQANAFTHQLPPSPASYWQKDQSHNAGTYTPPGEPPDWR